MATEEEGITMNPQGTKHPGRLPVSDLGHVTPYDLLAPTFLRHSVLPVGSFI